jgi:hypothetical protein
VLFQQAGELRAGGVSLSARGDSQLKIGRDTTIQSASVVNGSLAITSSGAVRQSGPIVASTLTVTALGGPIDLPDAGNAIDVFAATAAQPGDGVTFRNSRGFTVGGTGVAAGTGAVIDGQISLTALSGNVTVAAPLVSPQDVAFVRAPAGTVVVNAGVTNNVRPLIRQDSAGTVVEGGFVVGDTAGMISAVDLINTLPTGAVYEITVAASLTLTQTLTFNNAIAISGAPGVVLDGGGTTTDGLVLSSAAGGSRITNLAFANFTGTAVTINSAQNVAIRGLSVVNSGTGLALSGDLAGTVVQGSTFRAVSVGIRLTAAQRATLGGRAAADRNRIEGARQSGVVATGFCTGTRLVNTTFTTSPATRTRYTSRGARNLRISGTVVVTPPRVARAARGRSPR